MRIWLRKYTFLFMSGYGRDESAPTPNGLFATHSRYEYGILGWYARVKPLRVL